MVGLVTHEGSRFQSQGLATLETVTISAKAANIGVRVLVSDRNDADPHQHSVTRGTVAASARHQAELEARWRAHVVGRQSAAIPGPLTLGMRAKRTFDSADSISRLLNIDYSHLRVWRHALVTGASAALVLEDDARLVHDDPGEFLAVLLSNMDSGAVLVNCSRSIGFDELGTATALSNASTQFHYGDTRVIETDRALTNTVCANLYSRVFMAQLVSFIDSRGLIPVAPIDWRVNEFLLDNPTTRTWWVDPAPFVQGSMHDPS